MNVKKHQKILKYKGLMCDGLLCSPFKHGRFKADAVMGSVNYLTIIEGEDITKYGWEYRQIDDRTLALCPDCQREMDKV